MVTRKAQAASLGLAAVCAFRFLHPCCLVRLTGKFADGFPNSFLIAFLMVLLVAFLMAIAALFQSHCPRRSCLLTYLLRLLR